MRSCIWYLTLINKWIKKNTCYYQQNLCRGRKERILLLFTFSFTSFVLINYKNNIRIFLHVLCFECFCWIIEKGREFQKSIYFCFTDDAKASDCVETNWKILKDMGKPYHLTCLLRNLYANQEATVRTGHGTMDWLKIGKGVHQGCILSPCLFDLYAEYIIEMPG